MRPPAVTPSVFRVLKIIPPAVLGGPMVVGLAAAPDGAVWVSQNAGVVRIDPRTYRVTASVSKVDGLIEDEAWAYAPVSVGADGRVYLATPAGVSIFNTALLPSAHVTGATHEQLTFSNGSPTLTTLPPPAV